MDVGIYEAERRALDHVERVLEFTAKNLPATDPDRYPWVTSYGFARPESRWTLEPSRPPPVAKVAEAEPRPHG